MGRETSEILEDLDMAAYLDNQGLEYREKTGASGPQLNLKYCPACGDHKWRTWLNAETGLGNCFHGDCHVKTYNKWKFIREHLGNPPPRLVAEHIKKVAGELGWVSKRRYKPKPKVVEVEPAEVVLPTDCVMLPDANGNNLAYLEERGIDSELAKTYRLRYCIRGSISYESAIGEREEQFWGGRVVIPVYDLRGRLVNFQGRDITGKSARKYIFPPGLPSAGKFLYAGHLARGAKEVIVTEGVFDVMSIRAALQHDRDLHEVAAVATFGMHLSDNDSDDDQVGAFIKLKRTGLGKVTFMWDSEPKAIKNAVAAATRLSRLGLQVKVAVLPEGKDPNDCTPDEIAQSYYSALDVRSLKSRRELLRLTLVPSSI